MNDPLLLRPPSHLTPAASLRISQLAPTLLSPPFLSLPWPLSLLTTTDTPSYWLALENLFYACLRTGDDKSAYAALQRLKDRFGEANDRVMGLVGAYHEAVAKDQKHAEAVLRSYEEAITERGTNMVIRKRHVALLKSLGRTEAAIAALGDLLDQSPTDAEAWAELAELYQAQGMMSQAVFCWEEVLLVMPNAWNVHARLGEAVVVATMAEMGAGSGEEALKKGWTRALKAYCRSVELCDDYLRGFYGIKLVTSKLQLLLQKSNSSTAVTSRNDTFNTTEEDFPVPELKTVQTLNELATAKLAEIIRKHSTKTPGWEGYEEAEVIAARALLDRDDADVQR